MKDHSKTLESILGEFFRDQFHEVPIKNLRQGLKNNKSYQEGWKGIVELVNNRAFPPGRAFDLVAYTANLPLDKDSDAEAYKWLDVMVENAKKDENTPILKY